MGQTIRWLKFNNRERCWEEVKSLPEWVSGKWDGRFDWYITIFSVDYESRNVCEWSGSGYYRPKDFTKFRQLLSTLATNVENPATVSLWKEATDLLESDGTIFVNYG